jgi:endo-1,4-beta-xylanase
VVKRYKGKIYAWDVVNEAISDNPQEFLRNSEWYKICGEDFSAKAFEYAHAADPKAVLFYNDYNTERPEKRARIVKLLKQLKDAKVPIDAVGLQGHWSLQEPTEPELRAALDEYKSLGLKIQITELDVSIYPWEKDRRARCPDESDAYTPELEQKQTEQYKMFFKVFRDYKSVLTGVTFWNVFDKYSWLDAYPVAGRKNYPLLFDQQQKPKKAFYEVVKF